MHTVETSTVLLELLTSDTGTLFSNVPVVSTCMYLYESIVIIDHQGINHRTSTAQLLVGTGILNDSPPSQPPNT